MKTIRLYMFLTLIVCVLCCSGAAYAQRPDKLTGMTLEADALTLNVGETYTFTPKFTTENADGNVNIGLHLFSSDASVIRVADTVNTIEAVGGGEAVVRVYSAEYEFFAVCTVTVNGAPKSVKAKGLWEAPSAEKLAKIHDPRLKAFYEMLGQPEMAETAVDYAKTEKFDTMVTVTEGRASSLADAMGKAGLENLHVFGDDATIRATGTAEQFRILLNTESVLSIDAVEWYYPEAVEYDLRGQSDALSAISTGRNNGFRGYGAAVAFIDTGITAHNHQEFLDDLGKNKIIKEACFSGSCVNCQAVCKNGSKVDKTSSGLKSSLPTNGNSGLFFHGTHVAAIAAGQRGVAPWARIIAINVFSEYSYPCESGTCYGIKADPGDVDSALAYLNDDLLNEKGYIFDGSLSYKVTALNMSIGSDDIYTAACKKLAYENRLKEIRSKDVLIVAASGDQGAKGVTAPACSPSVFAVGALKANGDPSVASYSNHSKLVDMLAPGTEIYSAVAGTSDRGYDSGTSQAAAFVAGAATALTDSEKFEDLTADQRQNLLIALSSKTAAKDGIKKPVLDFSKTDKLYDMVYNPVYGGDQTLQVSFREGPFNRTCKISLYEGTGTSYENIGSQVGKTQNVKNPKTVTFKGLENNKVYYVKSECSFKAGKSTIVFRPATVYGMPVSAPVTFTHTAGISNVNFTWTKGTYDTALNVVYGINDSDPINYRNNSASFVIGIAQPNVLFKADVSKVYGRYSKEFQTIPVHIEDAVLSSAAPNIPPTAGNKKIWIGYLDTNNENVTSRIIDLCTKDAKGNEKKLKTLTQNTQKDPNDIVIGSLKNGTDYKVKITNVVKIGKQSYKSEPWEQTYWVTPDASDYYLGLPTNVSLVVGDRSVTVSYDKNFAIDGYRFDLEPIEPSHAKTTKNVPLANAKTSYSFTGLTNGTVYKLSLNSYFQDGKNYVYSPLDNTMQNFTPDDWTDSDRGRKGLLFIPLPEPKVAMSYQNSTDATFYVTNDDSADGFVWLLVDAGATSSSTITGVVTEPFASGNVTYANFSASASQPRQLVVMLYKDYDGLRYYGPAAWITDPTNGDFIYGYGPKSVELGEPEIDLTSLSELSDAMQIDGMVRFVQSESEEKSVDPEDFLPEDAADIAEEAAELAEAVDVVDTVDEALEDNIDVTVESYDELPEAEFEEPEDSVGNEREPYMVQLIQIGENEYAEIRVPVAP